MGVTAAYLLAAAADEKTDLNIPRFDGGTALHAAAALLQQSNLPSAERGKVKEAVRAILQRGGMIFPPSDKAAHGITQLEAKRKPSPPPPYQPPVATAPAPVAAASSPASKRDKKSLKASQASPKEKAKSLTRKSPRASRRATDASDPASPLPVRAPVPEAAAPPASPPPHSAVSTPQASPRQEAAPPPPTEWVEPEMRSQYFQGNIHLEIVSCSVVAAKGKEKEHARYIIAVSNGDTGASLWKLSRRYSDFEDVAKQVDDPAVDYHLPKKGWGFSSKLKTAENRIPELNLFLHALRHPRNMGHPAVKAFCDVQG
eukprot:m.198456 g.198456  ORF g.198456 m.198456 type:complete len:315 (+) comp20453_c0_seq1:52-996(+)